MGRREGNQSISDSRCQEIFNDFNNNYQEFSLTNYVEWNTEKTEIKTILLSNSTKTTFIGINPKYYNLFVNKKNNLQFFGIDEKKPIFVKDNNKIVGVVMPMKIGDFLTKGIEILKKELPNIKEIFKEF